MTGELDYWKETSSTADFRKPYFENSNGDVLYFNNLLGWNWKLIYGEPGKMVVNRELYKDEVEEAKQWAWSVLNEFNK